VNFTTLGFEDSNDTTDDLPPPFVVQNDGNAYTNVSISATSLWHKAASPTANYQYKADNVTSTGENDSSDISKSILSLTNVPTSSTVFLVYFNYTTASDSAEVDLSVSVPTDEGAGVRNSTITFTGALAE
jgi:predicted phosphohydrolase